MLGPDADRQVGARWGRDPLALGDQGLARVLGEEVFEGVAAAGHDLVEGHAERVEIGPSVERRVGVGLLGRHVEGVAHDPSARRRVGVAEVPRDAEVDQLDQLEARIIEVGRDEDVGRLDVAVDELARVHVGERVEGLAEDLADQLEAERLAAIEVAHQIRAVEVVHREPKEPVLLRGPDLERADQVGVHEGPAEPGLLAKAPALVLRHVHLDHLERRVAVHDRVEDLVDLAEAALPEPLDDLVGLRLGDHRAGGQLDVVDLFADRGLVAHRATLTAALKRVHASRGR